MNNQKASLLLCIMMDLIGYDTYALTGLGEFADIIWAPVSAFIFYKSFGGWRGTFVGLFNFLEELLPGTDFIPSFTILWVMHYMSTKKNSTTTSSLEKSRCKLHRLFNARHST